MPVAPLVTVAVSVIPWIGAVLRGGFGWVLKELSCRVDGIDCGECPLARTCAYGYVFRTPVPRCCSDLKPYTHAPHPFAFRPPMLDQVKGQTEIDVDLMLVGKATEFLPYFRIALAELGRRGLGKERIKFTISQIQCLRTGRHLDRSQDAGSELAFPLELGQTDQATEGYYKDMNLFFLTPLYLKTDGKKLYRFDFRVFILSLIRRLEDLALWHCGVDLHGQFHHLVEAAEHVRVTKKQTQYLDFWRGSASQGQHIPVGGLSGGVSLFGSLNQFELLFKAAESVGVGNKTSFGSGQVKFVSGGSRYE